MILVDSDVLTALVNRGDRRHSTCVEALRGLREPLGTVWPVLSAALAATEEWPEAQAAILEMVARGAVGLLPLGPEDVPRLGQLITRPARKARRLSPAHAALVRVAERDALEFVFTLSSAQLAGGRIPGRRGLRFLPEERPKRPPAGRPARHNRRS